MLQVVRPLTDAPQGILHGRSVSTLAVAAVASSLPRSSLPRKLLKRTGKNLSTLVAGGLLERCAGHSATRVV